ncbi:TPA: DUF551 domain-containing protein [Klebsiella michiganensis]
MIPDKDLTDDVLDEIIAGAKTSMEQYLALSLKAEREVWRKEGPTDDERIMAIEGIHNCERCGDEGWVVGEMGITRCACGHPGNSPVIPDGYVMVPKCLLSELRDWAHPEIEEYCEMWAGRRDDEFPALRKFIADTDALLAAPPQPQNAQQNIPEIIPGWIPVSERLPEEGGRYWCYVEEQNSLGKSHYQWNCSWNKGAWSDKALTGRVTHWMPLPAAPQEPKP